MVVLSVWEPTSPADPRATRRSRPPQTSQPYRLSYLLQISYRAMDPGRREEAVQLRSKFDHRRNSLICHRCSLRYPKTTSLSAPQARGHPSPHALSMGDPCHTLRRHAFAFPTLGRSPRKIARMTLTVKLDWNWSSFQLANSAPPLSVTDSAIAPSARIQCPSQSPGARCHAN